MKPGLETKIGFFMRRFGFSETPEPKSVTLDDLFRSMEFLSAEPSSFAYDVDTSKRDFDKMYGALVDFVNSRATELRSILVPVFCHTIMHYVKSDDPPALTAFFEKYIDTLPDSFVTKARNFFENIDSFHAMARLFATQKFIVKSSRKSVERLNAFLNERGNSELRLLITKTVVLEPEDVFVPLVYVTHNLQSRSQLSLLHARICGFDNICCGNEPNRLYGTVSERTVGVIDTSVNKAQNLYSHVSTVTTMSASSTGQVLFSGDFDGRAVLWSDKSMRTFTVCGNGALWCSAFAPRGGVVAVGSHDTSIVMLDATIASPFRNFIGHREAVTGVAFHPNCSIIGSVSMEPCVRLWDVRDAASVRLFHSRRPNAKCPCFSPNGEMFAFVDDGINVCHIVTGNVIKKMKLDHAEDFRLCGFSQDCEKLFLTNRNGQVCEMELEKGQLEVIVDFRTKIVHGHLTPFRDEMFVATERTFAPNLPCVCL